MAAGGTRERIIQTAFELFKQRDYDAVTVNDICEACGVTKTTFYYHMDSKDQIIAEYYRDVVKNLPGNLLAMLGQKNSWQQVLFFFDTLIETSGQIGPELYGRLFMMNLRRDRHTFDLDGRLTEMMVGLIASAQREGLVRNQSEPARLYVAAAHVFEGYEVMWCVKRGSFDRKRYVHRALEDMLDVRMDMRDPEHAGLALQYE